MSTSAGTIFFTDWNRADAGDRSRPAALFIHGLACDSHDWSWQLATVAATRRVVALDLPGHGRSHPREGDHRPAGLASEVAELADALDLGRCHVIGHSLGAAVASVVALNRPDLVRSIVSVDQAVGLPEPDLATARQVAGQILGAEGSVTVAGDYTAGGDSVPEWLRTWRLRRLLGMEPVVLASGYLGLREPPHAGGRNELPSTWVALYRARRQPVLALCTDPEQARRERELESHPRSRTELWERCGHWIQIEQAERFNAVLLEWLEAADPE